MGKGIVTGKRVQERTLIRRIIHATMVKKLDGREAHAALSPDGFRGMGGFSIFYVSVARIGELSYRLIN